MIFKTGLKTLSSLFLAFVIFKACSPVSFESLETIPCDEFPEQSGCQFVEVDTPPPNRDPVEPRPTPISPTPTPTPTPQEAPKIYLKYNYDISLGEVAFLFVLDISSSTAVEHRNLASQLSPFLHSIKDLKYHVALITMDISSSPNNPVRGAYYQDGQFIPIGGRPYLSNTNLGFSPDSATIESFERALEREETIKCDKRNQPRQSGNKYDRLYEGQQSAISCPSSDERGTYAMNLALQNPSYREFFNRDHVIFIPISDEDVRSGEDFYNQSDMEHYRPEDLDEPSTLIDTISRIFPRSRTFSFHPIIIPPGDSSCLTRQNRDRNSGQGSGRGYYGELYAQLTRPRNFHHEGNFLRGDIISICDRNYESQLSRISLYAQRSRIPLPCHDPESVELFSNGRRVGSDYEIEGRTLYVSPSRSSFTLSSRVEVVVYCEK